MEDMRYLGIKQMLNETVNQKSKDKTPIPNMASMVLSAILSDTNIQQVIYRYINTNTGRTRKSYVVEELQL